MFTSTIEVTDGTVVHADGGPVIREILLGEWFTLRSSDGHGVNLANEATIPGTVDYSTPSAYTVSAPGGNTAPGDTTSTFVTPSVVGLHKYSGTYGGAPAVPFSFVACESDIISGTPLSKAQNPRLVLRSICAHSAANGFTGTKASLRTIANQPGGLAQYGG